MELCFSVSPGPLLQRALTKGADLHFSFYKEASPGAEGDEGAAGMRVIHIPRLGSDPALGQQPDLQLVEQLMAQHQVPEQHRHVVSCVCSPFWNMDRGTWRSASAWLDSW